MGLTLEEKQEKVKDLRPIDDVFFEVLAENKDVCEEILQTILEDTKLVVTDVIVQSSQRNLYGRSVRLDALCTLGDGTKCNIEVQRSDNDNHLKRARFNASVITAKDSNPGDNFKDVIELYIVYISEFDIFNKDKTIYHVEKVLRETGDVIDVVLHEIFVNTVIDDGTDIADLMACFTKKEVKNPKFPHLSNEVHRLKTTEGGAGAVCKVMEMYETIAKEAQKKETRIADLAKMLSNGGTDADLRKFLEASDDEIREAKEILASGQPLSFQTKCIV